MNIPKPIYFKGTTESAPQIKIDPTCPPEIWVQDNVPPGKVISMPAELQGIRQANSADAQNIWMVHPDYLMTVYLCCHDAGIDMHAIHWYGTNQQEVRPQIVDEIMIVQTIEEGENV